MIELHQDNSHEVATDLFVTARRVAAKFASSPTKRGNETPPPLNSANDLSWDMLAFWSFVVFSVAAFCFSIMVLFGKCNGG